VLQRATSSGVLLGLAASTTTSLKEARMNNVLRNYA